MGWHFPIAPVLLGIFIFVCKVSRMSIYSCGKWPWSLSASGGEALKCAMGGFHLNLGSDTLRVNDSQWATKLGWTMGPGWSKSGSACHTGPECETPELQDFPRRKQYGSPKKLEKGSDPAILECYYASSTLSQTDIDIENLQSLVSFQIYKQWSFQIYPGLVPWGRPDAFRLHAKLRSDAFLCSAVISAYQRTRRWHLAISGLEHFGCIFPSQEWAMPKGRSVRTFLLPWQEIDGRIDGWMHPVDVKNNKKPSRVLKGI